jgi:8-oxo-dGTP pyrophosphatase MutT (NUDIX family)
MPHIHTENGQIDFTASAFIVHDDRVLLLKHKIFKRWAQPGGHIELTDSVEETLYKEIEEETGLRKESLRIVQSYVAVDKKRAGSQPVPFDVDMHDISNHHNHRHIDLAYLFTALDDTLRPGEGESQELRWYSSEEVVSLEDIMNEKIRYLALWAIDYVKKKKSNQKYE